MTDEKAIAEKITRKAERYEERAREEVWCALNDMDIARDAAKDEDLDWAEDLLRSALRHLIEARTFRARGLDLSFVCEAVEGADDE